MSALSTSTCEHHKTCGDCFSPNTVRDLENTVAHLAHGMAEAAEWNLATLEELCLLKGTSQSRKNRQKDICLKLLQRIVPKHIQETIPWGQEHRQKYGRTKRLLDASKTEPEGLKGALDRYAASLKP